MATKIPVIGVLGLQGDFAEHISILRSLGVKAVDVRLPHHLNELDGLIIPGGESTTIGKLMKLYGMDKAIIRQYQNGMAIWGTCAGAILLAKKIEGSDQPRLNLMDISIRRNDYGRQIDSFEAEVEVGGIGSMRGVFIRAPVIKETGEDVEVLAHYEGNPIVVRQGNLLASTFHPELSNSQKIHEYFINKVVNGR